MWSSRNKQRYFGITTWCLILEILIWQHAQVEIQLFVWSYQSGLGPHRNYSQYTLILREGLRPGGGRLWWWWYCWFENLTWRPGSNFRSGRHIKTNEKYECLSSGLIYLLYLFIWNIDSIAIKTTEERDSRLFDI